MNYFVLTTILMKIGLLYLMNQKIHEYFTFE